ncbi:MAG TPA: SDR family NAD(P)-dependent oxidoreductase [Rubrobacteraceae bacterium]|nr:SDR family NAD(P)-dependent oxidoreductase [Rubrobacteraceae bacterium]
MAGKIVVVLGASSPRGSEAVRMLAGEGANLVLGGRSREKLEALEAEIHGSGGRAVVVGVHLVKRHHSGHLAEAAVEAFGGLDALLFMAHAYAPPVADLDPDAWERSVDVNVRGFMYSVGASLPAMRAGGGGRVILVSDEGAERRDPLYGAGRAFARAFLAAVSRELAPEGVSAGEVVLDGVSPPNSGRCAEVVREALVGPAGAAGEVPVYRTMVGC